jgi:Holliday junction resolvasome RuvABC endonuclease subunit
MERTNLKHIKILPSRLHEADEVGHTTMYHNALTELQGIRNTVLACDPSFTAWGWAIMTPEGKPVKTGCIKTAPENKKTRIRKSDDRTRRTSEIVHVLLNLIKEYNVGLMVVEAMHGSQNASAAVTIGIAAGIVQTLSDVLDIPVEYYSEQDSKKCALGKKAATKDDMVDRMSEIFDADWTNIKYIDEAVADSLAVFYCAQQNSQMLKMMRK